MFARNCWYVAVEKSEVTDTKPIPVTIAGENIVLYRDSRGSVVAMADLCPHRLAPLSLGRIEGDDIRCMYHGIRFSPTGKCLEVPGQDKIPSVFCVRSYAAFESHQWIWVWIGDPARVDAALVPDRSFNDTEHFHVRTGSVPFSANYELFNDNTCDLSHVAFVHEATFSKLGSEEWAARQPVITRTDHSVKIDRWFENIAIPQCPNVRVDFSSRAEMFLPGIFLMDLQAHPTNTAAQLDYGDPQPHMQPLYQSRTIQTMRPIDATTSRFFFSISIPRWMPAEALEPEFEFAKLGFAEDKAMIEAQQRSISAHPEETLRMTMHDAAGAHIRKLIRETLKAT